MMKLLLVLILLTTCACTGKQVNPRDAEKRTIYYDIVRRQHPPEEVYSRVTWSHLPQPIPAKAGNNSPLLEPTISFELPNSNLQETVEALAQAIGFRWDFPPTLANRPVSINRVGTISEILAEIEEQARVKTEVSIKDRVIRVIDPETIPTL